MYIVHVRIIYSERDNLPQEVNKTTSSVRLGGIIAAAILMSFLPFAVAGTYWEYDDEFQVVLRVPQVQHIVQQTNEVGADRYDWFESNLPIAELVVVESEDVYDFVMEEIPRSLPQVVVPEIPQSVGNYNEYAYWEIVPVDRQARETETRIVQECFEYDFCINYIIKDSDALLSVDGLEVDCNAYPDALNAECLFQERIPTPVPTPAAFEDYP